MKSLVAVVAAILFLWVFLPSWSQAQTDSPEPATSAAPLSPSETVDHESALTGDSRTSNAQWNEFFHSKPGLLTTKTAYIVSIDYTILASSANTQFYMMFRSKDKSADQGQVFWLGRAGQTGRQEASMVATNDDYYLLIGIENRGAIKIDDLTIRTDPMNTPHDVHLPTPTRDWTSPGRTAYYVDSLSGDDSADGLAPEHAWKSLDRVNTGTFGPGDEILLKSGSRWTGVLTPGGSGSAGEPIRLAAYGEGPKPSIDAQGRFLTTLYLDNSEYWDVDGLDVANTSPWRQPGLSGVCVSLVNFGTAHEIHLRNLNIHDVHGSNVKDLGGGNGISCTNFGDKVRSRFDGLLIEGCHLTRTDRNGITMSSEYWHRDKWFPSLHVVIRKNRLDDIGGDGIVPIGCDGALVEGNVIQGARRRATDYAAGIWPWSCDNTVVQHNEVSGMKGTNDGEGYDSDWNCRNSLFQYNFSHDNDGGFMLICDDGAVKAPISAGNTGTVVRYNISIHDHDHTFNISGPMQNTKIYDNVCVIGGDAKITVVNGGDWGGTWPDDTQFLNNVFYAEGNAGFKITGMRRTVFDSNAFWGAFQNRPADAHAVTKNPRLAAPESARPEPRDVRLMPGSPCIGAGTAIPDSGGHDFWNDPVPPTVKPDIGADQTAR